MSYYYDGTGGFTSEEERRARRKAERSRSTPPPKKDGDEDGLGGWIFIAIMFMVAWPIGLILLINKLSETKRKTGTTSAAPGTGTKTGAQSKVKSAASSITRTPKDSAGGARAMQIVGIVLLAIGALTSLAILGDLGFYVEYGYLWDLVGQLFMPAGFLAGGAALLVGSRGMRRRMRRFAKYLAAAGTNQSISLSRLASAAEVSERRVEKDLDIMIEKGMWGPGAYVDLGVGKLFRTAAAGQAHYDAAESARQQETAAATVPQAQPEGYGALLRRIRQANDRIDDPQLSAQIDRLEEIAGRIFRVIENEPGKKEKAGTFLNYYLPTTQKLLDAYAEFEEAGVSGGNLSTAKRKIEQTMANIVRGFERQLDDLYRNDTLDIDSDIRVMEHMLRRDSGRVEDDFGLTGTATATQGEETIQ